MAAQKPNKFTSYDLTPEEERMGLLLTDLNVQVLRNELSTLAETKINLLYTSSDPQRFMQEEAYIRGKMDCLDWLLAVSEQMAKEQLDIAKGMADTKEANSNFIPESPNKTIFG